MRNRLQYCIGRCVGLLSLLAVILLSNPALADLRDLPWGELEDEVWSSQHLVSKTWTGKSESSGKVCDASFEYTVNTSGILSAVEFDLNADGTISAYIDLHGVDVIYDWRNRAWTTGCVRMGWAGAVWIERAEIYGRIISRNPQDASDLHLSVIGTHLGTVHLVSWMPTWMEQPVTNWINTQLSRVWGSALGEYFSREITKLVEDNIPGN